eukprot:256245-Prymnesium_polylepis.1
MFRTVRPGTRTCAGDPGERSYNRPRSRQHGAHAAAPRAHPTFARSEGKQLAPSIELVAASVKLEPVRVVLLTRASSCLIRCDRERSRTAQACARQPEHHAPGECMSSAESVHQSSYRRRASALADIVGQSKGSKGEAALVALRHVTQHRADVGSGLGRQKPTAGRKECTPNDSRRRMHDERPHGQDAQSARR